MEGARPKVGTITCFLCGGTHIYPGPRYETHLINEHGAIFDIDFLIKVSLHKQNHSSLPDLSKTSSAPNGESASASNGDSSASKVITSPQSAQTEGDLRCVDCKRSISEVNNSQKASSTPVVKLHTEAANLLGRDIKPEPNEEPVNQQQVSPLRISNISTIGTNGAKHDIDHDLETMDEDYDNDSFDGSHDGNGFDDDEEQEDSIDLPRHFLEGESGSTIPCWLCPICPMIYKRHSYFKQHMCIAHELQSDDALTITSVEMTEEEFLRRSEAAKKEKETLLSPLPPTNFNTSPSFAVDKAKRKVVGKEWAPNSFSSRFTCYFCNEQFRKDYKLKLHLMLNHKGEPAEEMAKAKEELIKAKLDGCVHKCAICGNKYNSVANFTRHLKDVHSISRSQYKEDHGSSEVVSRMFKCELCEKEVKHTRNIIGAHMKMVHLISWSEYQEILVRLKAGETIGDLPNPELFDCIICGVSVKYKREHLNKKHQLDEEVYEELVNRKKRGEDISDSLPDREIYTCTICERECLDFKRHLQVSHQLTEEEYTQMFTNGMGPQVKVIKQGLVDENGDMDALATPERVMKNFKPKKETHYVSPNTKKMNKEKKEKAKFKKECDLPLSTDLQCYFNCEEAFKKDYQLHLHLKLKHRNEDPEELKRAYEAANEEIALTRRSASIFNCALCPRIFNDNGAFYGHIQNKHNVSYREYKEKFGRCETESAPFECKICGKVIKYDRNTVHTHLKNVHGINWTKYLDRIRRVRHGLAPLPLPQMEFHECRVCNVSVKYLKEHLRNAHKITEKEYDELFGEDDDGYGTKTKKVKVKEEKKPKIEVLAQEDTSSISSMPGSIISDDFVDMAPQQPKAASSSLEQSDLKTRRPPKADIQNKANKTCSVCQVTYDARKSFIEHCQVTHGMKFKTKSGVSIPPPTNTVQIKQEPVKRRYSEELDGPPAKKHRSYVTSEGYEIEIEGAPETGERNENVAQYQQPGVNKWNQCSYRCGICAKASNSRNSINSHINNDHGISSRDYKENYPSIEVNTVWFLCRLCGNKVKFVKDCVVPHLKMCHTMELTTYESDWMQPEDWPSHPQYQPPDGKASTQESRRSSVQSVDSGPGDLVIVDRGERQESPGRPGPDIWNRCQFQCRICQLVVTDRRIIKSHVATSHSIKYTEYLDQYGDPEIPTEKWVCAICGSETRHARNDIYIHLRDVHKMTVDQYANQYGSPPALTPPPSGESEDPLNQIPSVNSHPTLFSAKWNKCRFSCVLCEKVSNEKRHIRNHVASVHGTTLEEMEAEHGDCEIHTEYFFCAICHAEVKHCHKNIVMHLQRSHNSSLQVYEEKYGEMDTSLASPVTTAQSLDVGKTKNKQIKDQLISKDGKPLTPSGRIVRGDGDVPCGSCGKRFSTVSNMQRHQREHCPGRNNTYQGLGSPTKMITPSKDMSLQVKDEPEEDDGFGFTSSPQMDLTCPEQDCNQVFERSLQLKRHLASSHKNEASSTTQVLHKNENAQNNQGSTGAGLPHAPDPAFTCGECGSLCGNASALKSHMTWRHKPKSGLLKCKHCEFTSRNSYIFDRHTKAHEKKLENRNASGISLQESNDEISSPSKEPEELSSPSKDDENPSEDVEGVDESVQAASPGSSDLPSVHPNSGEESDDQLEDEDVAQEVNDEDENPVLEISSDKDFHKVYSDEKAAAIGVIVNESFRESDKEEDDDAANVAAAALMSEMEKDDIAEEAIPNDVEEVLEGQKNQDSEMLDEEGNEAAEALRGIL